MIFETTHMQSDKSPAGNMGLAQWHQLLFYIDSFALRNPSLRQAPKR